MSRSLARHEPARRLPLGVGGMLEAAVHKVLVRHLEMRTQPRVFWAHIPNGEARGRVTGAILKSMGVKRGVPDLFFVIGGQVHFLELKREKGGTLSPDQKRVHAELREAGAIVATAYGLDDAIERLILWRAIK
jgi:hypothetical protein